MAIFVDTDRDVEDYESWPPDQLFVEVDHSKKPPRNRLFYNGGTYMRVTATLEKGFYYTWIKWS